MGLKYSVTWLAWGIGLVASLLLIHNPLYTTILLLAAATAQVGVAQRPTRVVRWRDLLLLGGVILAIVIGYSLWIARHALPTQLETALLRAALWALAWWTLVLCGAVLWATVETRALVYVVPMAFYRLALTTMGALRRGVSRLRRRSPASTPDVQSWLAARGIDGGVLAEKGWELGNMRLLLLLTLVLLGWGIVSRTLFPRVPSLGYVLVGCAAVLLVDTIRSLYELIWPAAYGRETWRNRDALMVLVSAGAAIGAVILRLCAPTTIAYPLDAARLPAPAFSLWIGLLLALLALPGWMALGQEPPAPVEDDPRDAPLTYRAESTSGTAT